jgi:hypothetical protein
VLRFAIDEVSSDRIAGWAFDPDGPTDVTVAVGGEPVGRARAGVVRPDVGQSLGDDRATASGFEFRFAAEHFRHVRGSQAAVDVRVGDHAVPTVMVPVVGPVERPVPGRAPLPAPIVRLLQGYSDRYDAPIWSDDLALAAVADLRLLVERGPRRTPELHRYLGFVGRLWLRAAQVERFFPRFNEASAAGDKDESAVQNSAIEVFAIGLHLASLQAAGATGALLEFGCFKGFSTAILSDACDHLGLAMHVFDSFAGLPSSASAYYRAGDFAGSRHEVEHNVEVYGRRAPVEFHEGFFADSLQVFQPDRAIAIFMDVDLESSSRDVMAVLARLDPRGVLFSHECSPEMFGAGTIVAERGPDAVVPPILDRFADLRWPVAGRFLHGHTGAFWHAEHGIPPLPIEAAIALRDLALAV